MRSSVEARGRRARLRPATRVMQQNNRSGSASSPLGLVAQSVIRFAWLRVAARALPAGGIRAAVRQLCRVTSEGRASSPASTVPAKAVSLARRGACARREASQPAVAASVAWSASAAAAAVRWVYGTSQSPARARKRITLPIARKVRTKILCGVGSCAAPSGDLSKWLRQVGITPGLQRGFASARPSHRHVADLLRS